MNRSRPRADSRPDNGSRGLRSGPSPFRQKRLLPAGRHIAFVQMTAGLGVAATLLGIGLAGVTGPALGIAAGTFLYIALVELLPDVLHEGSRRDRGAALVGLILGVTVIGIVS